MAVQQLSCLVPWLAPDDVHLHWCHVDIAGTSTHEVNTHVDDASIFTDVVVVSRSAEEREAQIHLKTATSRNAVG